MTELSKPWPLIKWRCDFCGQLADETLRYFARHSLTYYDLCPRCVRKVVRLDMMAYYGRRLQEKKWRQRYG